MPTRLGHGRGEYGKRRPDTQVGQRNASAAHTKAVLSARLPPATLAKWHPRHAVRIVKPCPGRRPFPSAWHVSLGNRTSLGPEPTDGPNMSSRRHPERKSDFHAMRSIAGTVCPCRDVCNTVPSAVFDDSQHSLARRSDTASISALSRASDRTFVLSIDSFPKRADPIPHVIRAASADSNLEALQVPITKPAQRAAARTIPVPDARNVASPSGLPATARDGNTSVVHRSCGALTHHPRSIRRTALSAAFYKMSRMPLGLIHQAADVMCKVPLGQPVIHAWRRQHPVVRVRGAECRHHPPLPRLPYAGCRIVFQGADPWLSPSTCSVTGPWARRWPGACARTCARRIGHPHAATPPGLGHPPPQPRVSGPLLRLRRVLPETGSGCVDGSGRGLPLQRLCHHH